MDLFYSEASENFTDTPILTSSRGQHSVGRNHSSLYLTEKSKTDQAEEEEGQTRVII